MHNQLHAFCLVHPIEIELPLGHIVKRQLPVRMAYPEISGCEFWIITDLFN
jgi:hypothetical protein